VESNKAPSLEDLPAVRAIDPSIVSHKPPNKISIPAKRVNPVAHAAAPKDVITTPATVKEFGLNPHFAKSDVKGDSEFKK
jgi:hypothetical protein